MRIFKYAITQMPAEIPMPLGAKILAVQMQDGVPTIWASVDKAQSLSPRYFRVLGTGHEYNPNDGTYIDTFQDGGFVWHLFELRRKP